MQYKLTQFYLLIVLFIGTHCLIQAQTIRFNEAVSSNSTHLDEDEDSPDWFELHNIGGAATQLEGWTVSDRIDEIDKWAFPSVLLEADDYLAVWASGKDRPFFGIARTLFAQGDEVRYLIPNQSLPNQWNRVGFVDLTWEQGKIGLGYGDGDDLTLVPQGTRSVFLRKNFNISDIEHIEELFLDIDYDDSFVAYLNGEEIARANIEGSPPFFNATAITDREAQIYLGNSPERYKVENPRALLQNGTNTLAIQVHNISSTSSDLSIIPYLTAIYNAPTEEGTVPPSLIPSGARFLHTNFKIASAGETLYLFNSAGEFMDSLRVEGLISDVSIGIPAEGGSLQIFDTPTPNAPNPPNGFLGINPETIVFSHPGGLTENLSLSLTGVESPVVIRYTLDATEPNENSLIYSNPISINQTTVVRARAFRENYIPSRIQTRTYIFDGRHELPLISIVSEPSNFFDSETGFYVSGNNASEDFPHFGANFWEDWERPIHFSFYEEDGSLGLAFNGGSKIFGGWSRGHPQHSLSIFARNRYGLEEMNYPIFPNRDYTNFQALVLRNSGNDWSNSMIRDATTTGLMEGTDLEFQAYRPAVVYINGAYWGIHNIREKINEHFLATKFNIPPDELDLLELDGQVIHGDNQDYLNLIDFVEKNTFISDENYQVVTEQIDIENFVLYTVAQIYCNNTDWPGNNIKFWRPKDGKWRWILFDTDFGFGPWGNTDYFFNTLEFAMSPNGPAWPNPPWSTLLFRRLLQNTNFKQAFANRMADELNTRFLPDRVTAHIDRLADAIAFEINPHYDRWGQPVFYWFDRLGSMKTFADNRPNRVKHNIITELDLPAYHRLTLQNDDLSKGFIEVNSLTIEENEWQGDYFEDAPIRLKAVAKQGYQFAFWTGANVPNTAEISVNMTTALTMKAHFEMSNEQAIVINEINYNSNDDFDTEDWVELYNPNESAKDLSNWVFKDSDDSHGFVLPEGTFIDRKGYLILTRNAAKFQAVHPDIPTEKIIGDFDFGLSSSGDAVRLYNDNEVRQDEVYYLSDTPWPSAANGAGPTLELISPELDNSLPESWAVIHEMGSPFESNMDDTSVDVFQHIHNLQLFPNPFTDKINIQFDIPASGRIAARLFDRNGSLIHTLFEGELNAGAHQLEKNLDFLPQGIYFLQLEEGESNQNVAYIRFVKI